MKKRWPYVSMFFGILTVLFCLPSAFPSHIHDPSTIIRCKGDYWLFATGNGVVSWHSRDLVTWGSGPPVFPVIPDWTREIAGGRGYFWAPDVIHMGDRYLLYYVVSRFGSRTSAIGLVTSPTLDPTDPAYHWTDRGAVVRSSNADDFNAIDPCPRVDTDGRMWMSFGSFWSGIKLVELDPATGLRKTDAPLHALARAPEIEASYILIHGGYYYLFVNWGLCCRGIKSTYNIRVGRSTTITGPYLDKNSIDMRRGGGTLLLGNEGQAIGPGQTGILQDGTSQWMSYHFYNADKQGLATLGLRKLDWSKDNWPIPGALINAATP